MAFVVRKQEQRSVEEPDKRRLKIMVRGVEVADDKAARFGKRNPEMIEGDLGSSEYLPTSKPEA